MAGKTMAELVEAKVTTLLQEYNPYHGADGRFTSEGAATSRSGASGVGRKVKQDPRKYSQGGDYQSKVPATKVSQVALEKRYRKEVEKNPFTASAASRQDNIRRRGQRGAKGMKGVTARDKGDIERLRKEREQSRAMKAPLAGGYPERRAAKSERHDAKYAGGSDYQRKATKSQQAKADAEMEYRNSPRFGSERSAAIRQDDAKRMGAGQRIPTTHNQPDQFGKQQRFERQTGEYAPPKPKKPRRRKSSHPNWHYNSAGQRVADIGSSAEFLGKAYKKTHK